MMLIIRVLIFIFLSKNLFFCFARPENVQKRSIFLSSSVAQEQIVFFKQHNYEELTSVLHRLADRYPSLTHLYSIGNSVQGRKLWVLAISAEKPSVHLPDRPEVKLVANMHGDETAGKELLLNFADELLMEFMAGKKLVVDLLNDVRIHLLPSLNPDEMEKLTRENGNGVNLNRNFPDVFENNDVEREPETVAIMRWDATVPFVLGANYHGGTLVTNYPYDNSFESGMHVYSATPDDEFYKYLATEYAKRNDAIRKKAGCPRPLSPHPQGPFDEGITNGASWYRVYGGMQDYNYVMYGTISLTLEISCNKNPPDNELYKVWEENKDAMLDYLLQIKTRTLIRVMNPDKTEIARARIDIISPESDAPMKPHLRTSDFGRFWLVRLPGSYELEIFAEGRKTESVLVTIREDTSSVVDVVMTQY